jgi:hypothetical protein
MSKLLMSPTEGHQGELSEAQVHSFIIRLWLEDATEVDTETNNRMSWRGHITHIPGNERSYVKDFDGIKSFIGVYLQESTREQDE